MNILSKKSLGISSSVVVFAFVLFSITPSFVITEQQTTPIGFSLSIDDALGKVITLENLQKFDNGLKFPTYLPETIELIEIRSFDDSDYISMLYSSEEIMDLSGKTTDDLSTLDLTIFIQKMENNPIPYHGEDIKPIKIESEREGQQMKTYFVEPNQHEFEKLVINSVPAVFIPSNDSDVTPNQLNWWEDDKLYMINSGLPKSEMISVAESME